MEKTSKSSSSHHILEEIASLALIATAFIVLLSLFSYHPFDLPRLAASYPSHGVHNLAGRVGAWIAETLVQTLGLGGFVLTVLLLYLAYQMIHFAPGRMTHYLAGSLCILMAWVALPALWLGDIKVPFTWEGERVPIVFPSGGWIGSILANFLPRWLGDIGASILITALFLIGLVMLTSQKVTPWLFRPIIWIATSIRLTFRKAAERHRRRKLEKLQQDFAKVSKNPEISTIEQKPRGQKQKQIHSAQLSSPTASTVYPSKTSETNPTKEDSAVAWGDDDELEAEAARWFDEVTKQRGITDQFVLPPYQLLAPPENTHTTDSKELTSTAQVITEKLAQFKVEGVIKRVLPGPVVTIYEYHLAAGIKYSRIQNLSEDLALALGVEAVRIDRMPTASSVAIEVPNRDRSMIQLRTIIESEKFQKARHPLPLAIGQTVLGEPYTASLIRMPHLLIAGATGSGKSVTLNSILCSILLRHAPNEVRLILVDPKMVELKLYNEIPHLMAPVLTSPQTAAVALKWLTSEMAERQRILAFFNVRNILQFNQVIHTHRGKRLAERFGLEDAAPIPFIVVIIDEFADLMAISSREIEDSIQRLAQMARAVGIHLIVATQRPSVDIITGVIKANFPCRIAFRVASSADSRTILDRAGAERLLGRGDMLFVPPESYRMLRLHGAYVSEQEIEKLVRFWRRQGKPLYTTTNFEALLKSVDSNAIPAEDSSLDDPLYEDAVRIVLRSGRPSISFIQRSMRIGYNRAARLIEAMEVNGIVSPPDHTGQRQILTSGEPTSKKDNL